MENNLGSLSYSLNIDLDPKTIEKIEKQLANINLINSPAAKGIAEAVAGDFSKVEQMAEKTINNIKDKIKALEAHKGTLPIADVGNVQTEINQLKNVLKMLEKPVEINLTMSDISKMSEATLTDIQAKIKALQSYKGTINVVDTEQIQHVNNLIENLKQTVSTVNTQNAGLEEQKNTYEEIVGLVKISTGANSEQAEQIAREQIALASLRDQRKQLDAAEKAGAVTTEQSIKLRAEIAEKEILHKTSLAQLNNEIKNEIKGNTAAKGSINELRATLLNLQRQYDNLSEEMRSGTFGEEMVRDIQLVDTKLKTLEATTGRFGRNVGNYASGMYGLTYSIQQVARELPNIAISPQMFIMAISNNLPILADELQRARIQVKMFNEQGIQTPSVLKMVMKSIFSWQTALVALITVFTVFGKEIFEWTRNVLRSKDAVDKLREAEERLNETTREGIKNAMSEITKLNLLYKAATDTTRSQKERNDAVDELQRMYPDYLSNIDDETIKAGKAASAYDILKQSIIDTARAKAYSDKITENQKKIIDLEAERAKKVVEFNKDIRSTAKLSTTPGGSQIRFGFGVMGASSAQKDIDKIDQQIADLNNEIKRFEGGISISSIIDGAKKSVDSVASGLEKFVDTDKQALEIARNQKDIQYAIELATIEAWEEGDKKKLALMDLNHKRELEMLDRHKEDQIQKVKDNARAVFNADPKNKGKNFDDSTISLSPEEEGGYNLLRNAIITKQNQDKLSYEKKSYEELVKATQDAQDKINAIEEKYGEYYKTLEENKTKITQEEYDRRKALIDQYKGEEVSAISDGILQMTDSYQRLFTDISDISSSEIENLINKWNSALSGAKRNMDGTFSLSIDGKNFTTTEQQMASLVKNIKKAEDELKDRNPFKSLNESIKELKENTKDISFIELEINSLFESIKTSDSQKEIDELIKEIEKLKALLGEKKSDKATIFQQIAKDIDKVNNLASTVSDSVSSVMDSFGASDETKGTFEDIMGIVQGTGDAAAGIARLASGDVIGGLTQAVKGFANIITSINSLADRDNEKRIKQLQKEIDKTAESYEKLGRAAEQAMTGAANETKKAQVELLRYQQQLIKQQIKEEEAKKKTDKDKIKDWEDELTDIGYEIEDIFNEISDSIIGDIQSLADEISSAIVQAAEDGEDAWKTTFESINDWIEEAIINLYKMAVVEPILEEINARMKEMLNLDDTDTENDLNTLTPSQVNELIKMAEDAATSATDLYESGGWKDLIDSLSTSGDSEDSALSQSIQGIQESNPGLIEAYLNTIRDGVISGNITGENTLSVLQVSQHIQSQALSELQAINSNTLAMVNAFKSVMANSSAEGGTGLRVYIKG